jgi:sulfite exporter TauE/SafE
MTTWSIPLAAGVAFGLASSAHCAAMCGPLVLSIGRLAPSSRRAQLRFALLHHAGRAAVYVLLALPAGLVSETLALQGFGRAIAIGAGLVLLLAAATSIRVRSLDRLTSTVSSMVTGRFAPVTRWAAGRPLAGPLATGALHGLLPCGLVYAALTTAAATGDMASAAMIMAGFALGTAPVLIALTAGAASVSVSFRPLLRRAGPVVLIVAGLLLIARGVSGPHRHPAEPDVVADHMHHL